MPTDPRLLPFIAPARASHAKFFPRGPFVSIILAQLADESAYGTRTSGTHNYFGIKATKAQIAAGDASLIRTREWVNGTYHTETLYFANYPSPEACFDAHSELLTHTWYADCIAALTPQAYAGALHADHYATEPNYAKILIDIMNYNNLYAYDKAA